MGACGFAWTGRSILVVSALALAWGCGGQRAPESTTETAAGSELPGTEWTLVSLADSAGESAPPPGATVSVRFDADGKLGGSAGCNRYFGSFQLGESGSIAIGQTGSTRMACADSVMAFEDRFLSLLGQVAVADRQPDRLELRSADASAVLRFSPMPPGEATTP
jgi:heat shock protein HslJ